MIPVYTKGTVFFPVRSNCDMILSALILIGTCSVALYSQLLPTRISCLLKFTFHGTHCASMQRDWILGCPSGIFRFYFILSQNILRWACFLQNQRIINVILSAEEMLFTPSLVHFGHLSYLLISLPNVSFQVPWMLCIISSWTRLEGGKESCFLILLTIPQISLTYLI